MEPKKILDNQSNLEEKKNKAGQSHSLTSDYAMKLL